MSETVVELAELESERWNAIVGPDPHRLESLFHDDLSYTHANGMTDTKRSYIDALARGTYRYRSAQGIDVRTRVFDNTGVITGRALLVAEVDSRAVDIVTRYSAVWLRADDGWQLICWHACPATG